MSFLFAVIDVARLYPLAIFGAIAIAVWWLMDMFAGRNYRAEERLDELRDPNRARANAADSGSTTDTMTKMLAKASPALSKPLQPKTEEETNKIKARLAHAGFRHEKAPGIYFSLKTICGLTGFLLGGGGMLFMKGATTEAMMYIVAVSGVNRSNQLHGHRSSYGTNARIQSAEDEQSSCLHPRF